ncbi:MAG TPA: cobalamin-dependent protein [Planctomycetota bacterium]|nr:cobalamin-dependent protein [Planctomycetota bacterium]
MKILLAHSDFAPASLALINLKGYALAEPALRERAVFRTVKSHVTEAPDAFVARLVKEALDFRPDVIGLSVYIWSRFRMYEATRRLREALPDALIVWGGPDVSDAAYSVELMAEHDGVDVVVRDEGERTFRRLLLHRAGLGPPPSELRGVTWRDRATGAATANENVDYLDDLDEIPSMLDSDEIDFDGVESLAIETFRGCYMGCNYCYWGGTTRRAFSDARVFSDLGRLLALPKLKTIWFFDSMFGYKKNTAKAILRFIIERRRPDLSVTFYPNLDFLDDELCELFKQAKVYIETGIQTTNDAAYETLNRSWDRPFLDRKIAVLRKHGLASNAQQLILGLPNDTLEGFRESVDYAFRTRPETIFIFPFSVLPATGFWRRREEFDLRFEGEFRIVYASTSFPEADMIRGGLIMVGAKWYEKNPGLAQQAARLFGLRPSELFERFGALYATEAWGLPPIPENFPALRRKLLLQAFPVEDEANMTPEALRRAAQRFAPHPEVARRLDALIALEEYLNCDAVVDAALASAEDCDAALRAWREHPGRTEVLTAPFNVFDADAWSQPDEPIEFAAWPTPKPRDFFKKDRPRWRVVIGRPGALSAAAAPAAG